jgi:hypothetical protein
MRMWKEMQKNTEEKSEKNINYEFQDDESFHFYTRWI